MITSSVYNAAADIIEKHGLLKRQYWTRGDYEPQACCTLGGLAIVMDCDPRDVITMCGDYELGESPLEKAIAEIGGPLCLHTTAFDTITTFNDYGDKEQVIKALRRAAEIAAQEELTPSQ